MSSETSSSASSRPIVHPSALLFSSTATSAFPSAIRMTDGDAHTPSDEFDLSSIPPPAIRSKSAPSALARPTFDPSTVPLLTPDEIGLGPSVLDPHSAPPSRDALPHSFSHPQQPHARNASVSDPAFAVLAERALEALRGAGLNESNAVGVLDNNAVAGPSSMQRVPSRRRSAPSKQPHVRPRARARPLPGGGLGLGYGYGDGGFVEGGYERTEEGEETYGPMSGLVIEPDGQFYKHVAVFGDESGSGSSGSPSSCGSTPSITSGSSFDSRSPKGGLSPEMILEEASLGTGGPRRPSWGERRPSMKRSKAEGLRIALPQQLAKEQAVTWEKPVLTPGLDDIPMARQGWGKKGSRRRMLWDD